MNFRASELYRFKLVTHAARRFFSPVSLVPCHFRSLIGVGVGFYRDAGLDGVGLGMHRGANWNIAVNVYIV